MKFVDDDDDDDIYISFFYLNVIFETFKYFLLDKYKYIIIFISS